MLDFIRQFRGMIFKKKDNSATPLVYSSTQEGAIYNNNNAEMRTQIGGADRAVVTDSQSQTLTNKTLTSPVINSPTGIVKGDVGLGDVDNTSDATKNAAIAALTNKTINADLNTITNITTSNLKSGVLNVSTVLSGATDAQIPSAQAVKTYVDNAVASKDQASEISYSNSTSGLAATNVQDAIDEVDGNVDNLVTLSGVALNAVNLGAFTGATIPDNQTNKQAFQALETAHENHTGASSSVHGVTGSVVGTSDSQALTNKTIVVSSNTITTAASGNLAAVELNAALAELQGDIDSRATSTELSNHINNVSGAHAASAISNTPSGNLAAITVQAALNELQSDIDTRALSVGGSIQSPVRLDVKKDTKANLLTYAATASNGQLCFATDTKEMFQVLDGALVSVGSGGTSNVDALLTQTFDESALTDFTQTGLALIETNPMNGKKTARLIHQAATTQSFKYVKAVDPKYRGKNLTMSFQVRSSATAGNVTLNVYDETNAANLILSQSITLGSVTVSATTNSNTTLSGISSSDINKLKVGQTITGSGIATGTTISAVSVSALTATLSQAATASATVTLKVSDLPQKQSASFDVPNNCASISYTISALAESGLPETYIDDVVIQLTSAALTSTSVSIQTKNGEVVSTAYAEVSGTVALSGLIPFDNTVPQNTEGTQFLTVNYTPKRIGNKVRVFAQAYISEDTNTGGAVTMALFKDSDVNAYATSSTGADESNSGIDEGVLVLTKEFTASSLNQITFSVRGGGNQGPATVGNVTREGGVDANFGNTVVTSIRVEEIQVGDYSEATTIPLTSAVFATQPDSYVAVRTGAGGGTTNTSVRRFATITDNLGSAITYADSPTLGGSFTVNEAGLYDISYTEQAAGVTGIYVMKNQVSPVANNNVLAVGTVNSANSNDYDCISCQAYLNAGDVIRAVVGDMGAISNTGVVRFHISKVASTKQINISSDQKIDLPSSELRMGAYTGVASTNTRVAKWGAVEKLIGDAFTIVNDPALGFSLTMKKAGFLNLSVLVSTNPSSYISISRNATQFSTDPTSMTVGQNILGGYPSDAVPMSWSGKCNIGDVFRVHVQSGNGPYVNGPSIGSSFNALFQEDKVQVSLSNVLPQFTQSDSSVILNTLQSGASSYGSTNTAIYRFSNVETNIGSDIVYTDSATLGASFRIMTDGLYNVSWSGVTDGTSTLGISKNSSQLTTDVLNINSADRIAHATMAASGADICASAQVYLLAGDIVRPHGPVANSITVRNARNKFSISKVGKPNLTSVDVTPFTNYKGTDTENIRLTAGNGFGSPGVYCRRFLTTDVNTNKGIIQYTDSVTQGAFFTALKPCTATFVWSDMANGVNSTFIGFSVNSTQTATIINSVTDGYIVGGIPTLGNQNTDGPITTSATLKLNVGDVVRCHMGSNQVKSSGVYNAQLKASLMISAVAEADQIVSPISSFSSDTASLVYAPSTSYTLSTLANAPVGTFITFTYDTANNVTSRPQTTTAPTQTVSDMNINGIRLFIRDYNSTSTAASPCAIAIQVGKGFKGHTVDIYKSTGKVTGGSYDMFYDTASVYGAFRSYDETSGILYLDAGRRSANGGVFVFNDNTTQANGYVVINASKSPSLAAVPQLQPRIAYVQNFVAAATSAGSSIAGAWATVPMSQVTDLSGIGTTLASNQFVIPAGTFDITAFSNIRAYDAQVRLRNITDGTTTLVGHSAFGSSAPDSATMTSYCYGTITLNSAKTFELQYRVQTGATYGLGGMSQNFGENILTASVKIQKIK